MRSRKSYRLSSLSTILAFGACLVCLIGVSYANDNPVQALAPPPYDAGVRHMVVVDHNSPFDSVNGVNVFPRIMVGEVYYPIEKGSGGDNPITLSYYYGGSLDAYRRFVSRWLTLPTPVLESHLATVRNGIYAEVPIADGVFPLIVTFVGASTKGHQTDDLSREYASRGYIAVALDTPGITARVPLGEALEPEFSDLITALNALPACPAPSPMLPCYDSVHREYVIAQPGLWGKFFRAEPHIVQRAKDAVAMIDAAKAEFGSSVDENYVGVVGFSAGGPSTYIAPMLIDALRSVPNARYAGHGVVPVPYPVNSIGLDDGTGVFGDEIGAILCDGVAGCEPLEAAANMTKPVALTVFEEDQLIIPNQEWRFYLSVPGYVGVTAPPSPANRQPANLISFEAVPKGIPSIYVEVPDADHLDFTSDPLYQFFSTMMLGHERVFEPGTHYTPLNLDLLIDMTAHYSVGFFDLTLKDKRGSLGALQTGRYNNVTEDGRNVKVRTNSLQERIR